MTLFIYDLDHTLIAGDSSSLWMRYLLEIGWADEHLLAQEQQLMQAYASGAMDMHGYMQVFMQPLVGRTQAQVAEQVERFIEQYIAPIVYPQALATIAENHQQRYTQLIISATADFIVLPIAKSLNIEHALAVTTEVIDGCYTGKILGTPTYQAGKITRLEQWLGEQNNYRSLYFYSDSYNDLPLLEHVQYPITVNPDARLHAHAQAQNWPIAQWSAM